jgi:Helix-turn-helix domain
MIGGEWKRAREDRQGPLLVPFRAVSHSRWRHIAEAAQILRMSRAQLYNPICEGTIRPQKDGARTYITQAELERYVDSCGATPTNGRSGHAELQRPPP